MSNTGTASALNERPPVWSFPLLRFGTPPAESTRSLLPDFMNAPDVYTRTASKHRARQRLGVVWPATAICLGFGLLASPSSAADKVPAQDLTSLPLEKLMDVEVISTARHPEKIANSPAAISVLDQEDIHRSGALTIPDLLRTVPGMDVGQLDASQSAVSARGFNDVFANKLLVLQDGRSIYTPLFSGVFWDVQGPLLEDLERIEVIRGPGATLWGANAVNGVINIISKNSKDTQGTLISAGGGNAERAFASARYGGKLADNAYFRVYSTYFNRGDSERPDGGHADDSWQIGHFGFRADWEPTPEQDLLTFQGDAYRGDVNQVFNAFSFTSPPAFTRLVADDFTLSGGNLLGRWSHTFSPQSDLSLQVYYDRTERETVIFGEKRDTFDVDFQHRFGLGQFNAVTWGTGYRVTSDKISNSPTIALEPTSRSLQLFSGFIQDEMTLVPERLRLTLGTKLEHNDFTGWEAQPSGRLLWTPHERHTFWTAVSRAIRTPSRSENDVILHQSVEVAPGVFAPTEVLGNPSMLSEELLAYEMGYRSQLGQRASVDLALFYNDYRRIRSFEQSAGNPGEFFPANELHGDTYGFEAAGTLKCFDWWRLKPAYSFLKMELQRSASSTDLTVAQQEGKSPRHQFSLWSQMDLPEHLSLDVIFRFMDRLPGLDISGYGTLDARLAWQPNPWLELAIGGRNLLQDRHAEFAPSFIQTQRTEVERSVYGKITLRF
jgi:iron complex outermembrane recepter protein